MIEFNQNAKSHSNLAIFGKLTRCLFNSSQYRREITKSREYQEQNISHSESEWWIDDWYRNNTRINDVFWYDDMIWKK